MGRLIATAFFVLLIVQLYRWTKDDQARTSKALWLPTFWLFIGSSRNLSEWLHMSSAGLNATWKGTRSTAQCSRLPSHLESWCFSAGAGSLEVVAHKYSDPALFCVLPHQRPMVDYPGVAFKRWFRATGDIVMVLIILTDPDWVAALKRVLIRLGILLVPLSILFSRWYPQFGREFSHAANPIGPG